MEKKQYIRPEALVIELNGEVLMLEASKTDGESADGSTTEHPEYGGSGYGDDFG